MTERINTGCKEGIRKDEHLWFVLAHKGMHFRLALQDALACLRAAEEKGAVPKCPEEWWGKTETFLSCGTKQAGPEKEENEEAPWESPEEITEAKYAGLTKYIFDPEIEDTLYFMFKLENDGLEIALSDILKCLRYAENGRKIPELPVMWWIKVYGMYYGEEILLGLEKESGRHARRRKAYRLMKRKEDAYIKMQPAYTNTRQIVGMYVRQKISDNAERYNYCPQTWPVYGSLKSILKREKPNEFEIGIYNKMRENFDLVVAAADQLTGIYIGKSLAKSMLRNYVAGRGHRYYGADKDNLPWLLLYTQPANPVFGRLVRGNSPAYQILEPLEGVRLSKYGDGSYYKVESANKEWIDLQFSFIHYERKETDGDITEEMEFVISTRDEQDLPARVSSCILSVSRTLFPNLIHSERAKEHRDEALLRIARECMPDLWPEKRG